MKELSVVFKYLIIHNESYYLLEFKIIFFDVKESEVLYLTQYIYVIRFHHITVSAIIGDSGSFDTAGSLDLLNFIAS